MSKQESSLKDDFEKELEKIQSDTVLSPKYRKRKTITWAIRTIIACVLFIIFWKHTWVRWALIAYIPLNLLGLYTIHGKHKALHKKIDATRRKIDEAERHFEE